MQNRFEIQNIDITEVRKVWLLEEAKVVEVVAKALGKEPVAAVEDSLAVKDLVPGENVSVPTVVMKQNMLEDSPVMRWNAPNAVQK